ncbi:type I-G CRISPR-associated helicase/endonuclease Cas3g [Novipirellula sp. SH528]|uniref:type I-G CRISPR-associated helicase/endonuclease Cas3g n=1 Tax=Novipirellula sp. SH528 TaxID=3454466 RepID=UPI003F9F0222
MDFDSFFHQATGHPPYPYQSRLGTRESLPTVLSVPTGVGKTAAATFAWLYRRRYANDAVKLATPRRLVYCLPMRTLVEQTRDAISGWLNNLDIADPSSGGVRVSVLMGGENDQLWYGHPETDQVLIGTQDMLLSRALNRGYGMSRYAWPIQFSLLNNDCLWVIDETQLMGVGLTTSAQLAGLRGKLATYGQSHTLWMSATLDSDALATVDHPRPEDGDWSNETVEDDDKANDRVLRLLKAKKPCSKANIELSPDNKKAYAGSLAESIVTAHVAGELTLVVVNRVNRAQELFQAIQKIVEKLDVQPETSLIHSRFRPFERANVQAAALDESTIPAAGRILISTQAIEAGVDISSTVMFTELAPWSSLVQRFGRCNRRGTCGADGKVAAQVHWIDIDTSNPKRASDLALPYELAELDSARAALSELADVGPQSLTHIEVETPSVIHHVLRRKDLLDLFDTTADLSGNDLDVSRYIRESEDCDVQVYWRDWDAKDKTLNGKPPIPLFDDGSVVFPAPSRDELCSVSIAAVRGNSAFIKKAASKDILCYTWDALDRDWQVVKPHAVRPGMVLLFHSKSGGYDRQLGWTGDPKHAPVSDCRSEAGVLQAAMDEDDLAGKPLSVMDHLRDVGQEATALQQALDNELPDIPWPSVVRAAWWHDVGKIHPAFQGAVVASNPELDHAQLWAKSGRSGYLKYQIVSGENHDADSDVLVEVVPQIRRGFRHELASAIAWLQQHLNDPESSLIAYLIAAHHGKVRMSLRSMPNENRPSDSGRLFARGIWDGDELPRIEIGNKEGDVSEATELSLDLMQLGECEGQPSWLARTVGLRDEFGPFRLAFLESLVRVADWRGSEKGATE